MKILITGIHGFVGSNLVAALKSQYSIYGLDIISPGMDGVIATFSWQNLHEIPEVDFIIHLAGKAHDTSDKTDAQVYFDVNTGLTKKIFDWFLTSGAKKFIFFSSVKAAAHKTEGKVLVEDHVPAPAGPYGESKLAAEKYILERLPVHKSVYILRPCMIHGPGNKGNLTLLFKLQQFGLPWPLGVFDNQRTFCSIDNVIFIISQLLVKTIFSGIYQLADDEAISTNDLIGLIALSQNKRAKIWRIPVWLIKAFARVGDIAHLPLNTMRLNKLTETYLVSNQKIKIALDIDKMPVTGLSGLKKTFDSFKK